MGYDASGHAVVVRRPRRGRIILALRRGVSHAAAPGTLGLAVLLGCAEPAPPASTASPEAPAAADSPVDTYVEGSERVWNDARERGIAFRAVGQEPGWLLEIARTGELLLLTSYGQDTTRATVSPEDVERASGAASIVTSTDDGELRIDITTDPCTDTMSGEQFSRTVTVTLDATTYRGCGRALEPPA